MNFFFLAFLSLAVPSMGSIPLERLMQHPKVFAAAFSNASPETVQKMLGLVDKLLKEGKRDVAQATADHDKRKKAQAAAQKAFTSASKAFDDASDNLSDAETNRNNLVKLEKSQKDILDAAVGDMNSKITSFEAAKKHKSETEKRVADEKTALLGVIAELEKVKPKSTGRRLLSDADPDSVDKVIVAIKKLIDAGATEVAAATAAFNDATAAKDAAIQVEKKARSTHEKTFGALTQAQAEVEKLKPIKAEKLTLKNDAQTALTNANSALKTALAWMNQEEARVASETKTLNEVKKLLEAL